MARRIRAREVLRLRSVKMIESGLELADRIEAA